MVFGSTVVAGAAAGPDSHSFTPDEGTRSENLTSVACNKCSVC